MSTKPPSRLLRFSLTTTLNFRSPFLPVLVSLITSDIGCCIVPLFRKLLKSLFCGTFFSFLFGLSFTLTYLIFSDKHTDGELFGVCRSFFIRDLVNRRVLFAGLNIFLQKTFWVFKDSFLHVFFDFRNEYRIQKCFDSVYTL